MRLRRQLVVRTLLMLCAFATQAFAQTGRVTGVVTDALTNQPLSGVQIAAEGSTIGNLTNQDGRYLLQGLRPGTYTISATLLGHSTGRTQNVRVVADQAVTVDFKLSTTVLSLQELVVTGVSDPTAGTHAPFSIGKVSAENIKAVPTTSSAIASLQGKVAGASIVRSTGQPGEGVSVLLRTPTTIYESNSPMFVVDGVILSSTIDGTTLDLESLDIESIEVVKGAAASSLYGSKAASGVVQIRTSRGKNLALNQTRLTARSEFGADFRPRDVDLAESHLYLQNSAGQWVDTLGNIVDRSLRMQDPNGFMDNPYMVPTYDNVQTFFRPGQFQAHTVNLAYTGNTTNFLSSFNLQQQRGPLEINEGFQRMNLRVNLDHRVHDKFNFSISAYHNRNRQDRIIDQDNGLFWDLMLFPPDVDLSRKDANGKYLFQPDSTIEVENPLFSEQNYDEDEWRVRTLGNLDLRYTPFNWLNLQGTFAYDRSDGYVEYYEPKGLPDDPDDEDLTDGQLQKTNENADVMNAAVRANLLRNFGQLTSRVTFSASIERETNKETGATGSDFYVIGVPDLSVAATRSVSSSLSEIRNTGYYVDTGLEYGGKYIGSFLIRRDGSSLFGPEARWQNYYRAAVAYRMAEEEWFPLKDRINEFKLRYSRGTAGTRPRFSAQYETWAVSSTGAVTKETLGNRALEPGHTTEQEFGVDIIALNRYQLELTYATQTSKNQIIALPLPAIVGYGTRWFNTGIQDGHTYEATFQAQLMNRANFSWNATIVADRSRSKIREWNRTCFPDGLQNICGGAGLSEMWGDRFLTSVGELPPWHSGSADQFQVNDDGYLVWVGTGGDYRTAQWGTIGTVDGRTYNWGEPIVETDSLGFTVTQQIGNSLPDFSLGWLNNLNWRGFALHTHLHAQIGGETYNGTRQRMYQHLRHGDLDQAGKAEDLKKPISYYQKLYNANVPTSHFAEDATYLKLRALSLQYRFSRAMLEKIGIRFSDGLNLGVIGRNLLTFTGYKGFDPEAGSVLERWEVFDYPNVPNLTFSAEVIF